MQTSKQVKKRKNTPNAAQRKNVAKVQKKTSPLPPQYIITPNQIPPKQPVSDGGIPQIPPPQMSVNQVRNYPPPQVLFQNSCNQVHEEQRNLSSPEVQNNPQAPGTSNQNSQALATANQNSQAPATANQNSQPPATSNQNSQAPGTSIPNSPAHSHPSSQGHNFNPEPDLSDEAIRDLNVLLRVPGRERWTTVLHPDPLPNTMWFTRDSLTRRVTKVLQNKFDRPYYNWSCVPREKRELYLTEFAKTHTWDPLITGSVQWHFEAIASIRLKDIVSKAKTNGEKPTWIEDSLWGVMQEYWETQEAKARSETYSTNRNSDRDGLGPHVHFAGPKSYQQVQKELEEIEGRKVSFGEVFMKTHTKPDGTFVDKKAERIMKRYEKKVEEKMIELQESISDGTSPPRELTADEYTAIFLQSTEKDSRGNLYGVGSLKKTLDSSSGQPAQSSFTFIEDQLKEYKRQIEEQAALNAEIAAREERNAQLVAEQKERIAQLSLVEKYLRQTDPRYLDFMATQSANATTHTVSPSTTHPLNTTPDS